MKFTTIAAALLGSAASNSVPVMNHLPGWQQGSSDGQVEIRVFYDMLCPDSKDADAVWKTLLPQASPVAGKTYD